MCRRCLPVTITSNCFGARTSCIAALSTYMCELNFRVLLADLGDHFAPQDRGIEHVGLVDAAQLFVALHRRTETDVRNALHLALRVVHGVEAFVLARCIGAATAQLAEVDVTRQFADDHDVEAGHDFGLQ